MILQWATTTKPPHSIKLRIILKLYKMGPILVLAWPYWLTSLLSVLMTLHLISLFPGFIYKAHHYISPVSARLCATLLYWSNVVTYFPKCTDLSRIQRHVLRWRQGGGGDKPNLRSTNHCLHLLAFLQRDGMYFWTQDSWITWLGVGSCDDYYWWNVVVFEWDQEYEYDRPTICVSGTGYVLSKS